MRVFFPDRLRMAAALDPWSGAACVAWVLAAGRNCTEAERGAATDLRAGDAAEVFLGVAFGCCGSAWSGVRASAKSVKLTTLSIGAKQNLITLFGLVVLIRFD